MSFSRRSLAAVAGLLIFTLSACGAAEPQSASNASSSASPISITHAQGTLELKGPAQRIVVLDLGSLDTIAAVGAQASVVGVAKGSVLPKSLSEFSDDKYADVGTLFEPNIETIASLKPDLVIAGFRSAKVYPELAKHFPTIDITYERSSDFVADVSSAAKMVGKALGKEAEVDAQLAELSTAMKTAKEKTINKGTAMILMTSGGKVSLAGAKSRFGLIHTELGFTPAVSEADAQANAHGDAVSFEAIGKANPEWMFVVDRDAAVGQSGEAAAKVLDNELVAATTAWSKKQVVYLDGSRWYIIMHGVNNSVEMINEVTNALS